MKIVIAQNVTDILFLLFLMRNELHCILKKRKSIYKTNKASIPYM